MSDSSRKRWLALIVLCLGDLMIVLDTTIVNVALPSIREDLAFTETSLVWVVNAYMLTYGGFLLLGGRLGDLYGQRRLFLLGTTLFTLASLACRLARPPSPVVAAGTSPRRALPGRPPPQVRRGHALTPNTRGSHRSPCVFKKQNAS